MGYGQQEAVEGVLEGEDFSFRPPVRRLTSFCLAAVVGSLVISGGQCANCVLLGGPQGLCCGR